MDKKNWELFLYGWTDLYDQQKRWNIDSDDPLNNSISDKFSKKRFMEKRLRPMINGDEVMNTLDLL
jgi:hypothetical protein